jgi:uncharacterized membrane protein
MTALPPLEPPVPVDASGPPAPPDAPSWNDPTVARASNAIGGPIGRYAASSPLWPPLVVLLLLTGATLLLGMAEKSPCASGRWQGDVQYTHFCYSDVIPLWGAEELDSGAVPYRDHAVEYPVLTGAFMWVSAETARGVGSVLGQSSGHLGVVFGEVTVVGLSICAFLVTYFTVGAARRRPWDAALFAASPLLVFHAFSNWDLFAMVFMAGAMWAWSKERTLVAGVLIGLGTAAKLYPALLLVAIFVLALRTGRWREPIWAAVAAVLTWVAVNGPVATAYYAGWKEFYVYSADRDAEASTFWAMYQFLRTGGPNRGQPYGYVPPGIAVALAVLIGLVLVAWLALAAPRRPRLAQVTLLVVAVFLLTTKVWSPQYSIWLVPLVALARPRWRLAIIWQCSEIVVWMVTLLWLHGFNDSSRSIDYGWLMTALLIRDGLLLIILGLVVWEIWHPELDVVRSDGEDDPGGGVFAGAPDSYSLGADARHARADLRMAELEYLDHLDHPTAGGADPPPRN